MPKQPYRAIYDVYQPIDKREVRYELLDGTPVEPEEPVFTNPNDPVSPQVTTSALGAEDYPKELLAVFPDDPPTQTMPVPEQSPGQQPLQAGKHTTTALGNVTPASLRSKVKSYMGRGDVS